MSRLLQFHRAIARAVNRFHISRACGLLALLLIVGLQGSGALEGFELWTQDLRSQLRPPRPAVPTIVIAEISNQTLDAWPEPIVFWGARYARIFAQADRLGVRWIGLDVIPETSPDHFILNRLETQTQQMHWTAENSDRFLDAIIPDLQPDRAFVTALEKLNGRVVLADLPEVSSKELELLRQVNETTRLRMASVGMPPDTGGAVRNALLYYADRDGRAHPGFPVMLAALSNNLDPFDRTALQRLTKGNLWAQGSAAFFRIDYGHVQAGRSFFCIAAEKLETGMLSADEKARLRNAILLVGAVYSGANEEHRVPGLPQQAMSGIEIHAHALDTLLAEVAIKRLAPMAETLITLLFGAALLFTMYRPLGIGAALTAAGAVSWFLLAQWAFGHNVLVPVAGPLVVLVAPIAVFHFTRLLEINRQKDEIVKVFGRNISPRVRDYLLEDPTRLNLEGHNGNASVLFFDIRDSVRFVRSFPPDQVFAALNDLFGLLVPIVEEHGGFVNKFTGDGFMAIFGFPMDASVPAVKAAAQNAVDTAVHIVKAVHQFNTSSKDRQCNHQWRVGCGVYTGSLAYGNVGGQKRSEFTVIGETPSMAARLESLNKPFGAEIVVSEATWQLLERHPAEFVGPKASSVVGSDMPIDVHYLPEQKL
jgi:class 3 adenylate cyclase/CHASE2 domain-containing sensor protein